MAMGKRGQGKQDGLFVVTSALVKSPGHPFYEKLNEVFSAEGFDTFAEAQWDRLARIGLAVFAWVLGLWSGRRDAGLFQSVAHAASSST